MSRKGFFITGTDTGVGKTRFTVAWMRAMQRCGLKTLGMKPVAAGCQWVGGVLVNDDALLLQQNGSVSSAYPLINPYAFEAAVSPHIAARQAGCSVDLKVIQHAFESLQHNADCVVVEGVGGWEVPLSQHHLVADLAVMLALPVILVVGVRLGCLNHARLTMMAIERSGVECIGWVANLVDPTMRCVDENIETMKTWFEPPLLATLPYVETSDSEQMVALLIDRAASVLKC